MNDTQIKHMVDRFLQWRLPDPFYPDCGISFQPTYNGFEGKTMKYEPIGTNLFSAEQATAMVKHMLEGVPEEATAAKPNGSGARRARSGSARVR